MPQTQNRISFQASTATAPIKRLTSDYGDCLELLSAAEKLHLLSILALWQGKDTELSDDSDDSDDSREVYTLAEAIDDYPSELSVWGDVLGALECLEGIEVDQVLDLMVAISSQLREGVYQS
ncbi:MAG: hypothetical protein H7126_13905 [Candidatus Parcubacteria bacterium]|nr:hypothetical protein [Leptolyngbyaceae cyanobacterium LF-bin-113]